MHHLDLASIVVGNERAHSRAKWDVAFQRLDDHSLPHGVARHAAAAGELVRAPGGGAPVGTTADH